MKGIKKFKILLFSLLMCCLVFFSSNTASAVGEQSRNAEASLEALIEAVSYDVAPVNASNYDWDYSYSTYKCTDGGYLMYGELAQPITSEPISVTRLKKLTVGGKRDFLTDYYKAGRGVLDYSEDNKSSSGTGITEDTGTAWLEKIQNTAGVGSQLMVTLMSDTKPDYITADRIYKPFSGPISTGLALVSIVTLAGLIFTFVIDISFLVIPGFQLMVLGNESGSNGGGGKKRSFVSHDAMVALEESEDGSSGSQGQQGGSKKQSLTIYAKRRVGLVIVFCICSLYLAGGAIFALGGSIVDLMSGFLGI